MMIKKLAISMIIATMFTSLVVPASAKTKRLYVLTRFYCESNEKESTHDVRFSYNKKGLVTKQVDHLMDQPGKKGMEVDRNTYQYTYKGTKLVKKAVDTEFNPGITDYSYSNNKLTGKGEYVDYKLSESYTLKKDRLTKAVVKSTEDFFNYTRSYKYNKKGQLIQVIDHGESILDRFQYDQNGYATKFYYGLKENYQHKITYKHKLPSVVKVTDTGKKSTTYHLYYKKMKVSAVAATKAQQYSFTHAKDPKSGQLYDFIWPNSQSDHVKNNIF